MSHWLGLLPPSSNQSEPRLWTTPCTAPVWPTQHTPPLCVPQHSKHIKGGLCSKLSGIHCPMCRQQQHHHCSHFFHLYWTSCLCSSLWPLLLFPTYHKFCLLKNSPLCQVDRFAQMDLQDTDKTDAIDKGSCPRLMADMGHSVILSSCSPEVSILPERVCPVHVGLPLMEAALLYTSDQLQGFLQFPFYKPIVKEKTSAVALESFATLSSHQLLTTSSRLTITSHRCNCDRGLWG